MSQSEIRMCAGIGKSQNEDVVLNLVDKHPIIFDVAIAKSDKIAGKRMVAIFLGKWGVIRKHLDYSFKLVYVLPAPKHFSQAFFESCGFINFVFHESRNSLSLAGSSQ